MNENYDRSKKRYYLLIAMVGAIIGGLIVGGIFVVLNIYGIGKTVVQGPSQQIIVDDMKADTVVEAIAEVVPPSVVGIKTTAVVQTNSGQQEAIGIGSGFILTSNGYIATNQHVVTNSPISIIVSLSDGNTYEAELIWSDPDLDMAVIKIAGNDLPVIELGKSDEVKVGELAVAIGNPLGLNFERTVTAGIVSALNRSIPLDNNGLAEDLIQTDASINEGNSGGPLVNKQGLVIGINTYKLSTGEGMGFAIPIDILKPILDEIVTTGTFDSTVIGITGYDRAIADYYLNENEVKFSKGIYIASAQPNGGAANAGLKAGDIILKVDENETNTMLKMKEILYGKNSGDMVKIEYERNGKIENTEVVVDSGK
jgi:serine protease Do